LETKLADFFEPRLEPVTVLPCPFENPVLGLIVYLIWILGYECHDRLDTNVEKDG